MDVYTSLFARLIAAATSVISATGTLIHFPGQEQPLAEAEPSAGSASAFAAPTKP